MLSQERLSSAIPGARLQLLLSPLSTVQLATALLYVSLFAVGLLQFTDPDYFWHLRTGELIVETGSIPKTDPFSFSAGGRPWVAHEWLAGVVIYGTQALGGYVANVLLFTAAAIAALAVAHRTVLSLGASRWLALGLVAWAGLLSLPYWTVRPQVFTWLFFAVFLSLLVRHHRANSSLRLLPFLMLLWANLHLGHVIGLGLVGLYVLAVAVERLRGEPRDVKEPAIVLAACLLASLVNPNGIEQLLYPLRYLTPGNSNVALITEWQSPDFHEPGHLILALAILGLMSAGLFRTHLGLFLPCLALCFTYLALQSIRHQPLFAIVFLVTMGASIAATRVRLPFLESSPPHATHWNWLLLSLAIVMAAVLVLRAPNAQLGRDPLLAQTLYYPNAGADFVETNYPGARIFNTLRWGGFLISRLPEQRIFVDGRSDLYGEGPYLEYLRVNNLESGWQAVFDKYAVDVILIESRTPLAGALDASAGWQRVFTGPKESVFTRRPEP